MDQQLKTELTSYLSMVGNLLTEDHICQTHYTTAPDYYTMAKPIGDAIRKESNRLLERLAKVETQQH